MKKLVNIEQWERKEHYRFFSQFDEPFFGVTITVDCNYVYKFAKENNCSFFLYYLHKALKSANEIENFRMRIEDGACYLYEKTDASPTINRDNGTFGFSYIEYEVDESLFMEKAAKVIKEVRASDELIPASSDAIVIHFSAMPWLDFTSVSHARHFKFADSCPKISFGKISETDGIKKMPVSIHVHHALMDGYHVGLFVERYQQLLNGID